MCFVRMECYSSLKLISDSKSGAIYCYMSAEIDGKTILSSTDVLHLASAVLFSQHSPRFEAREIHINVIMICVVLGYGNAPTGHGASVGLPRHTHQLSCRPTDSPNLAGPL